MLIRPARGIVKRGSSAVIDFTLVDSVFDEDRLPKILMQLKIVEGMWKTLKIGTGWSRPPCICLHDFTIRRVTKLPEKVLTVQAREESGMLSVSLLNLAADLVAALAVPIDSDLWAVRNAIADELGRDMRYRLVTVDGELLAETSNRSCFAKLLQSGELQKKGGMLSGMLRLETANALVLDSASKMLATSRLWLTSTSDKQDVATMSKLPILTLC